MKPLIIHDIKRVNRWNTLQKELAEQNISEFEIIPAVKKHKNPIQNICEAHKNCIKHAVEHKLPHVLIMEDDVMFTGPGAYQKFISYMDELPSNWKLYFAGVYDGKLKPVSKHLSSTKNISGLHCYMVHSSFYSTLLSASGHINLDKWMTMEKWKNILGYVATPMLALQHDGYSDNVQRETNYNKKIYNKFPIWDGKQII